MEGLTEPRYAAIVLAGGAGRRLGGTAKPALPVGGRPMLERVLVTVADAAPRIVVGPPELPLPDGVIRTLETPPGGGPAAATAAGLAQVPAGVPYVALLAADLPLLTPAAVHQLYEAATRPGPRVDGAVYVDHGGRPQWLCGMWRTAVLRERVAGSGREGLAGWPLRRLLADLAAAPVTSPDPGPAPWWDCDTEADLRQARRWA